MSNRHLGLLLVVAAAAVGLVLLSGCPGAKVQEEPRPTGLATEPQVEPQQRPVVEQQQPAAPTITPTPQSADPTVYITNTGGKYHQGTCRYLSKSRIPISLSEAKRRGYTPCKVCKPPG